VETAEQERALRRLRRIRLATRLVVYGALALVLVPVIAGARRDARGQTGTVFVDGATSQGAGFTMRLDDGRPVSVGMGVSARCRPPLEWNLRWWSFAGKTARFRFADGRLTVREKVARNYNDGWAGDRNVTLEARVDGKRVRGTVRYVETIRHGAYPPYVCQSGDVSFSAG
jgi:hypothetical protein